MNQLYSDEHLDLFADTASTILITLDQDFTITYCNRRSAEIFGYTEHELLGKNFFDAIISFDLENDETQAQELRLVLLSPESKRNRCIIQALRKDGSRVLVFWNFMTRWDSDGAPSAIYCVGNDLTLLTDSFTRFQLAAQGLGFGQWRLNLQNEEGAADPMWYGIRGLTPKPDVPFRKIWSELIHSNDFPAVQEALDSYIHGARNLFFAQYRVLHPQDGWIWIRSTGHVSEWDHNGRPLGISGFEQNITGEISGRDKLKKNQELLEEVIKIGRIGYWVYDYSSNKIETISDTMEEILEIQGDCEDTMRFFNDFEARIHPEDRQRILAALFSPLDTERKTDCRSLRSSGEIGYLHIFSHPNHDQQGRVVSQIAIFQDMTEHKKVEMALRERHLSLFQALRASRAKFWQYDMETKILDVTDEASEQAGTPNYTMKIEFEEMIERWYQVEDRDWVSETLHRAIAEEGTFEFECRTFDENRKLKYVRQSGLVDHDAVRKTTKILGVILDISDIKEREEAVQESEARYRILFDQSFDAVTVFENERIAQCNTRAIELFHAKTRDELIGQQASIFFPHWQPDGSSSREKFAQMMHNCVNSPIEPFSWRARRRDGTEFEASISLAPVPGTSSSIYAMIRDVTQQQSAARAREHYRAYLAILAELRNFFYSRNEREIISAFLESVTKHFKISKAWYGEVKDRSICPSIHAGEALGFTDIVRLDLGETGESTPFPLYRAIKERRPIALNHLDPLQDHSPWSNFLKRSQFRSFLAVPLDLKGVIEGGIVFYSYDAGMFEDSVFEYLHSGVRELSRIISEKRLRELQQSDLEHAKEKAESAAKAKTRFLANMSHEIRTPMTAILGYAEMLNDESNSSQSLREMAGIIQSNARFLLQIINDILDFSKLEEDKMLVDYTATNLPGLISELYSFFSGQAREKAVYFHISNRTPFPEVIYVDAVRLKQILINLLGNAIKFTKHGGVRLNISWHDGDMASLFHGNITRKLNVDDASENADFQTEREPAMGNGDDADTDSDTLWEIESGENDSVFSPTQQNIDDASAATRFGVLRFEITDTGIGISPDQVQTVFSPFDQADTSTTRKFGGTGLGLAITRKLVRILHGKFTLQTRLGYGSVFGVNLPLTLPVNSKMIAKINRPERATQPVPEPTAEEKDDGSWETTLIQPPKRPPQPEPPKPTPKPQPLAGLKILLAEDGKDNQRLFTKILGAAGAEVVTADNGLIALKFLIEDDFAGGAFDVVLMDIQMPVMDGYTATQKIRAQGYDLPIIALTAHAMAEERQKCLSCGCNDYATKPIMRDELIRVILANVKTKGEE